MTTGTNIALRLILFSIFFILISHFCKCQVKLNEVQLVKIKDLKVQEYLKQLEESNIHTFSDITPSLKSLSDESGYLIHERKYLVRDSLEKVWLHYLNTEPQRAWNSNKIKFNLLYSRKTKKLFYPDDLFEKTDTGQILFLNLKLLKGIKNLAVAFEITYIDGIKKIIEFSYIKGNITEGKQQLKFMDTRKGYTRIVHKSFHKSNSRLWDNVLYPYFHDRVINNFHRNMRRNRDVN
jgi:hypothetical protein